MSRRGYEEIDIRERRRTSDREPEFLRSDYGRSSVAGPLVVRDDRSESIDIRLRDRRENPRDRETVEREELYVSRAPRDRDRLRERDVEREEITYRSQDRPGTRDVEREEITYRPRERETPAPLPPPQVAREREEYVFRRPREPSYDREEITIRERERQRERPRERDYEEEDIIIRRDERERPREREYRDEEIIIRRDERERDRLRDRDYSDDEIIIRRNEREKERPRERDYKDEEIIIRRDERDRERPRGRDYKEEEIIIRRDEKERDRPKERDRGYEQDEIIIRRDERDRNSLRPRAASYEREEISIRSEERDRPRAKSRDFRGEISIRKEERDRPRARSRDFRGEEITIRRDEKERERPREKSWERSRRGSNEDIIIRHDDKGGRHKDEVIIRRNEREPSPEPIRPPSPQPIRAPPIHQEIITHHHHIDHGFDRAPAPTPPKPRSPSPKPNFEEIEIRHRGSRNGRQYEDDILIERNAGGRHRGEEDHISRRRSVSPAGRSRAYSTRDETDIAEEADYYNRKAQERGYIGEGYNGATKDWAIVDVPPGTKRVHMEGIGGAQEDITWQRYNGVRRSKFIAEEEFHGGELMRQEDIVDTRDRGRRFVGQKKKEDLMWTEITKDLVIKDAIEEMGYDFEETEYFFYVMSYLRYEDVLHLVELTDHIKRDRRERIRQIEMERRERPRKQPALGWDEEKIYEREVIYDGPRPRRYR